MTESPIRGQIVGQKLTLEQDLVVSATRSYLTAEFSFSPEWDGMSIWAHFDKKNQHWKVNLHQGKIIPSDELNLTTGIWEVCFHGTAPDGHRITTDPVDLRVRRTNVDEEPLPGVPLEPAEQIDAKSQDALNTANKALEEVVKVRPLSESAQESAKSAANSAAFADRSRQSAERAKNAAAMSAVSANTAASNAKASEEVAKASESTAVEKAEIVTGAATDAAESAEKAKASEVNAAGSEGRVSVDAQSAREAAERASASESNAKTSETHAKASEVSAGQDSGKAQQALADLLRMLGTDIPTLVDGKVPMSQIPATATQEIYEITDENELTSLQAQRGDLAELIEEVEGWRTITKTWQCLGDSTVRNNWVIWGTAYAVQAGNATMADTANNANMINNHRMVEMTKEAFDTAVKDPNTYYLIHDPASEV